MAVFPNGKAIRTLNNLDYYNREVLGIEVDTSLPAERVIQILEQLWLWRTVPEQIRLDKWSGVDLATIRKLGKR